MTEPVPQQLNVLRVLCTFLEGINPTNEDPAYALTGQAPQPYRWDLRGKVIRHKTVVGTEIPVPLLAVLEATKPIDPLFADTGKQVALESWQLLLQGFAPDQDTAAMDSAYNLKAAVVARLGRIVAEEGSPPKPAFPEDYMLGNLLTSFTLNQGVVRPPDAQVSAHAFFYIPLLLQLKTDVRNPYA